VSQYPPDPNQPPPPPDPGGQWGAPPPQPPGPPDPYGAPPGPPPDPYGAPPGAPVGAPPGVPSGPGWGQQPPSGPGWGAGTPPPMGPAKKKSNPVIPILIVVALIAVGVGAFVLLSGGDDAGDSPESTVEALFDAGQDRDCEAAGELLSSSTFDAMGGREAALQQCQAALEQEGGLFSAEGAELVSTDVTSEDDSTATVSAEVRTPDGETNNQDYNLVKEDGEWKIDLSAGGGATPPDDGGNDGGGGGPASSTPVTPPTTDGSGGSGGTGGSGGSGSLGDAGPIPSSDPTGDSEQLSHAESCQAGDMGVCDDLYWETSPGSDLETYGRTCGGRIGDETRRGGQCEAEFG
jgi:hypothetical protein